jgi:hypothetical protein
MSKRQQLVSMYSMLDHVAQEASRFGHGIIATLAAAAAEATREELAALDRRHARRPEGAAAGSRQREKVDSFA